MKADEAPTEEAHFTGGQIFPPGTLPVLSYKTDLQIFDRSYHVYV